MSRRHGLADAQGHAAAHQREVQRDHGIVGLAVDLRRGSSCSQRGGFCSASVSETTSTPAAFKPGEVGQVSPEARPRPRPEPIGREGRDLGPKRLAKLSLGDGDACGAHQGQSLGQARRGGRCISRPRSGDAAVRALHRPRSPCARKLGDPRIACAGKRLRGRVEQVEIGLLGAWSGTAGPEAPSASLGRLCRRIRRSPLCSSSSASSGPPERATRPSDSTCTRSGTM